MKRFFNNFKTHGGGHNSQQNPHSVRIFVGGLKNNSTNQNLLPYCLSALLPSKSAFTLAEVLITLAIIGIVASLTVPTVIKNYQKREAITHLKKMYSVMQQVINESILTNGSTKNWDYTLSNEIFFKKYLFNYLSTIKACTYTSVGSCVYKNIYYADGSGSTNNGFNYYEYLKSGEQIGVSSSNSTNLNASAKMIGIDLNGDKKPNKYGYDVFLFEIRDNYGFVPYNCCARLNISRDSIKNGYSGTRGCSKEVTGWLNGSYCAALIMKDGWKISDDYPW